MRPIRKQLTANVRTTVSPLCCLLSIHAHDQLSVGYAMTTATCLPIALIMNVPIALIMNVVNYLSE